MNGNKRTAKIAGLLILMGMMAGILSIAPSVDSSEYLTEVAANQNQVYIAAFFQFTLAPIYIAFALLLYPILRKYNESLAFGFVIFRIIAGVFQLMGVIILAVFIFLSQEFLKSTSPDLFCLQFLGDGLKLIRDLTNHVGVMLATGLGNLILYYILYKTRLIPHWLSSWGFLANILAMVASFLIFLSLIDVITPQFIALTIPLVLQELFLAIWLIFRRFNFSKIDYNTD